MTTLPLTYKGVVIGTAEVDGNVISNVVFHDNELSKEIRRSFQTMSLGPFSIAEPSEDPA